MQIQLVYIYGLTPLLHDKKPTFSCELYPIFLKILNPIKSTFKTPNRCQMRSVFLKRLLNRLNLSYNHLTQTTPQKARQINVLTFIISTNLKHRLTLAA